VVFLLDSSGDPISPARWAHVLGLMMQLVNDVNISYDAVRVAVVDGSGVVFRLDHYTSKPQVDILLQCKFNLIDNYF